MKFLHKKISYETLFISIMAALILLWAGLLVTGNHTQLSLFFLSCKNYMADFTNVILYSADRDPYGSDLNGIAEHAYFPLSYVITYLFSGVASIDENSTFEIWQQPVLMNLIVLFMGFFSAVYFVQLYDLKTGAKPVRFLTAAIMLSSGIYMFMIERGQLLIIAAVCTMFYLVNYKNENPVIRELAFIALAIAAALKFSPAFLGILLLLEKRYREAFRLIVYGIVFCFAPFLFFKGGFANIPLFLTNVRANMNAYWGDGLYHFVKSFREDIPGLIAVIQIVTYFIAAILLISAPLQKAAWRKMLSLLLIMIMVPAHSGSYNVVFLFPAWILFLNEQHHEKWDILYFLCMIALLSPLVIDKYTPPEYVYLPLTVMYLFMGKEAEQFIRTNKEQVLAFYKDYFRTLLKKPQR